MARVQARADFLDRAAHADRIDSRRSGQRADDNRHVVTPAVGIDDIGEQKSAALVFGNAAQKLAAHQRMQFGILVDGPVDANQQAAASSSARWV